jgi:hypothetical protein
MGKPHNRKFPILPSTIRRGTTLNTSVALDSPSVMSKLLTPPHAYATATSSAEFENATNNLDDASTVLDESGSLGSFLDASIARAKMGNITVTLVSSPESRECPSDDLDDTYIELDDDFIAEAHATHDANDVKKLLARRAVRYNLSPDAKFATSPINIRDKDYDFSLDLSFISIVEKDHFCGTEGESAMAHMNELSTLSNVFSDDIKLRTYFVAKIFPFSLKGQLRLGLIICLLDLLIVLLLWLMLSFRNIFLLVLNMLLCRKSLTLNREKERYCLNLGQGFVL